MYRCELDHKEGWMPKNWCFWIVVLEKTLESPLDCKIKPVNPKGNQPWIIHWKDLCWKNWSWSSNTLATWCEQLVHWKKTLMLGKIEGKRRRELQRMKWLDIITDPINMSLSKLWETVMDRGAWCVAFYGVIKSWTWLSDCTTIESSRTTKRTKGEEMEEWELITS